MRQEFMIFHTTDRAHHIASWPERTELTIWRAGWDGPRSSNSELVRLTRPSSPYDELFEPRRVRHMASCF